MAKDELAGAIAGLDGDKVLTLVREHLQAGTKPMEIINSLADDEGEKLHCLFHDR